MLATNIVNDGLPTDTVSVVAAEAPGIPNSLARLSFDSQTSMQIGWTAPSDDGGSPLTLDYELYWDVGQASGYQILVSTTGGVSYYTVTSLTATTTYFFKVKAVNEVGASTLSNGQGFLAGSIPSQPRLLTLQ